MRTLTSPPAGSRAAQVLRYGVALATGLAAMLVHVPLHRHFGPSFDPLLLVIVGVSAWYGGLGPGLVTLAVVALGAMVYAPPPAGLVHMASRGDAMWLVVYGVSGLVLTALIAWLRAARRRAEAAGEQVSFLSEVSEVLASSLDFRATLSAAARLAVPRLADWCAVDVVDADGRLRRLAIAHTDPGQGRCRLGDEPPVPRAGPRIRCRRSSAPPARSSSPRFRTSCCAASRGTRPTWRACGPSGCGPSSSCRSPPADGRWARSPSSWPSPAGTTAAPTSCWREDLARRAAIAVDNARLYREAEEALQEKARTVALLDTVFRGTPIGLAFVDRELRFVRINDALAALNRTAVEAHLGRTVSEVLGDSRAAGRAAVRGGLPHRSRRSSIARSSSRPAPRTTARASSSRATTRCRPPTGGPSGWAAW